jgi:hypothetical protein
MAGRKSKAEWHRQSKIHFRGEPLFALEPDTQAPCIAPAITQGLQIMAAAKSKKSGKPTVERSARRLTAIAMRHLQSLSPEERETRLARFERAIYRASGVNPGSGD